MNQDLVEEELDRELVHAADKHGTPYLWSVYKMKVGPKALVFSTNFKGRSLRFTKRNFMGPGLEICAEWTEEETKKCDLGHSHVIKKDNRIFHNMTLQWENVESLIEWLQQGSWTEVQKKPEPWKKVVEDTLSFLESVEGKDSVLKPASQRLRTRLRGLL